jgi:hypothetical protein
MPRRIPVECTLEQQKILSKCRRKVAVVNGYVIEIYDLEASVPDLSDPIPTLHVDFQIYPAEEYQGNADMMSGECLRMVRELISNHL